MLCSACRTLSTEFHIVSIDGHVVARDFSLKLLVRCCGRSGRPYRDLDRDTFPSLGLAHVLVVL